MHMCIFVSPLLINCWLVSTNFFSVVEVSQQHGVSANFVEIGRGVEEEGCVSAWRGKANDLILLLVIVGESH